MCAICAELQRVLGVETTERLATEAWFCELEAWRNFKRDAARVVQGMDGEEDTALATLVEVGMFAELIFGVSNQARDQARRDVRLTTTDAQALVRLRARGFVDGKGKLWGRNNCLADSLLQLLVKHRVIYGDLADEELSDDMRGRMCNDSRDLLCESRVLHPRRGGGELDRDAYLQHHVHARPTIEFFLRRFRNRNGIPAAGIELRVHTRNDDAVGGEGSVDSHIVLDRREARSGTPLVVHLFCHTGRGIRA